MTTTFLFGAGASAFSGGCSPKAPPLGAQLFRELADQNGIAASISGALREKFEENFEAGMAEFDIQRQADTPALIREMAVYFAQFSPLENNTYRLLIRALGGMSRHVVMASLNYDILLELAVNLEGYALCYNTQPSAESSAFEIVKPHGSCNYLPNDPVLRLRHITILASNIAHVSGPIRPAEAAEVREFCAANDVIAPAMSMYAAGKRLLNTGPFMEDQRRRFEDSVAAASRVVLIGVAMNPLDDHIWNPLARTKAKLYIVDPNPDQHLAWARDVRRRVYPLAEDFHSCIPKVKRLLGV